ncbi:MAG: capsular polysaccharide synthesis protein [bacterium]
MNIFTYWEGPRPDYIDVCLRSLWERCGTIAEVHIITPATLREYIGNNTLHPRYESISDVAIRADCIRAALLATHGGWWWDADTIILHGFPPVSLLMRCFQGAHAIYTTWDRPPLRALNGYIYMAPGCDVAKEWLARLNARLERKDGIAWAELGETILTPLLVESNSAWRIDRNTVLPVDIDSHVEAFFSEQEPLDWVRSGTVCFGLNHSYFMYHHGDIMSRPWDSGLLIHRLLRYAESEL